MMWESRVFRTPASNGVRRAAAALLLAGLIALAWPLEVLAHDERDHDLARRLHREGAIVSLEAVVAAAQRLRPGDILEVELERKRGRYIYEVEILDREGWVWELRFDAGTGRLLKEELERH